MNCKFCGQYNDDDKRFCTNCGAPADYSPVQPQAPVNRPIQPVQPQFRPLTPVQPKKKGISKNKTVFFWASKAAVVLALIMFLFPFMKFGFSESSGLQGIVKPLEMTGRELVFGIDDSEQSTHDSLRNVIVIISAAAAVVALFLPSGGAVASGVSAVMLYLYTRTADDSYTYSGKKISEWDGLITVEFQPALYASLVILIVAAVLAAVDEHKRRKMFESEQEFSFGLGGYM